MAISYDYTNNLDIVEFLSETIKKFESLVDGYENPIVNPMEDLAEAQRQPKWLSDEVVNIFSKDKKFPICFDEWMGLVRPNYHYNNAEWLGLYREALVLRDVGLAASQLGTPLPADIIKNIAEHYHTRVETVYEIAQSRGLRSSAVPYEPRFAFDNNKAKK